MKLALYARVACQDPRGHRLATQIGSLRAWAAARGHAVIREFVDDGLSGLRSDRPGLDALRSAAASHAFEAVLVSAPDRLTRVAEDCLRLVSELAAGGVRVLFSD